MNFSHSRINYSSESPFQTHRLDKNFVFSELMCLSLNFEVELASLFPI